jgi:hypothetical protein
MDTGAPFFFGVGVGEGVSLDSETGVGVGEGVGVSDGEGVGECLCLFLTAGVSDSSGVAVGETFLWPRLGDGEGVGSSVPDDSGVALVGTFLWRCFGDADGVGSGVSDGSALGDRFGFGLTVGLGEDDFFLVDVVLWCLRGVGVGVGTKIFLILSPTDSSAGLAIREKAQTPAIARINRA